MKIAVVMTARGEPAARLERAIASVAAQTWGDEVDVVVALAPGDEPPSTGRIILNPTGERSAGLNLALGAAQADIVVRLDARSTLPRDYIARCVDRLYADTNVGVVGGVQHAEVMDRGVTSRGIARALRNPWATGGAAYRRLGASGSVDTVYLGVFRRQELLDVGGWNESLSANEDFELCQRYRDRGRVVWLEDGVVVEYEPRTEFGSLWRQYLAFGRSKTKFWRHTGSRPNARQLIPLIAVPVLLVAAIKKPVTLVAALVGLLGLDHVADPHERNPVVRAVSCLAYIPIIGGWIAGVVAEAVRRS